MKTNAYLIKSISSLRDILNQMKLEEITEGLNILHGSSVGQHARHILEFVDCLLLIQEGDIISYDNRKRDASLEVNQIALLEKSANLISSLEIPKEDFSFKIRCFLGENNFMIADTNYFREELFVLDHTIHHLAILKIGITAKFSHITLPQDIGVTASTINARNLVFSN